MQKTTSELKPLKLLFICTHNRCRSILCEAITNQNAENLLLAKSAGSMPSGVVHPLTLLHLQKNNISTHDLKSQSWEDYESFQPDIVITVCDSAKNETCPVWFGSAIKVHWGLKDPSKLAENTATLTNTDIVNNAFTEVITTIIERVESLKTVANKHQKSMLTDEQLKAELSVLGISVY